MQHKCDICGKQFIQLYNLRRIQRIHTVEKPIKCDVCGIGFIQLYNRVTHQTIHTDKPYNLCDVCGKGFLAHMSLTNPTSSVVIVRLYVNISLKRLLLLQFPFDFVQTLYI